MSSMKNQSLLLLILNINIPWPAITRCKVEVHRPMYLRIFVKVRFIADKEFSGEVRSTYEVISVIWYVLFTRFAFNLVRSSVDHYLVWC